MVMQNYNMKYRAACMRCLRSLFGVALQENTAIERIRDLLSSESVIREVKKFLKLEKRVNRKIRFSRN
jgi:hypothetical protein